MTDESYTGRDAENEIEAEKLEEKKEELKDYVAMQKERVEIADEIYNELNELMALCRSVRRNEREGLDILRRVEAENLDEIVDDIEEPKGYGSNVEDLEEEIKDFRTSAADELESRIQEAMKLPLHSIL